MGWYDQLKKEQVLVNRDEGHSKFWAATLVEATNTATIRWGRLGTKGQNQTKTFGTLYEAGEFINGKMREKTRKGYEKIDQTKFDKLSLEAVIVGSQNKCSDLQWVEITNDKTLAHKAATETRLQDPDCNPGINVRLQTKKKYDGRDSFTLLFTFTNAYEVLYGSATPITKSHALYDLTQKVEEAVGRTLS